MRVVTPAHRSHSTHEAFTTPPHESSNIGDPTKLLTARRRRISSAEDQISFATSIRRIGGARAGGRRKAESEFSVFNPERNLVNLGTMCASKFTPRALDVNRLRHVPSGSGSAVAFDVLRRTLCPKQANPAAADVDLVADSSLFPLLESKASAFAADYLRRGAAQHGRSHLVDGSHPVGTASVLGRQKRTWTNGSEQRRMHLTVSFWMPVDRQGPDRRPTGHG
jgi:hypothetical protein